MVRCARLAHACCQSAHLLTICAFILHHNTILPLPARFGAPSRAVFAAAVALAAVVLSTTGRLSQVRYFGCGLLPDALRGC